MGWVCCLEFVELRWRWLRCFRFEYFYYSGGFCDFSFFVVKGYVKLEGKDVLGGFLKSGVGFVGRGFGVYCDIRGCCESLFIVGFCVFLLDLDEDCSLVC